MPKWMSALGYEFRPGCVCQGPATAFHNVLLLDPLPRLRGFPCTAPRSRHGGDGGHRTRLRCRDNSDGDICSSLAILSQQRLQPDCGGAGFSGNRGMKGRSVCEVRKGESEAGALMHVPHCEAAPQHVRGFLEREAKPWLAQ